MGTWDVRTALRINALLGHGGDGGHARLLHVRPLNVPVPRKRSHDVVCVQDVGRLDKRLRVEVKTTVDLEEQEGAPCAHAALPPSTLLALPQLTRTASTAALALREARAAAGGDGEEESGGEESDEEELDPAQVDSPTTLRALAAVGVTNVADASPGTLQRAWSAVRGIGRTLFGGDDDDAEGGGDDDDAEGGGDGVQGTGDSVLEYLDTDTDAERLAKTIAARAARHNPRELDRPLESSEKQAIHDTMLVGMATGVYPKNSDSKREYAAAAERLVCARKDMDVGGVCHAACTTFRDHMCT